jgi:RNA ligase
MINKKEVIILVGSQGSGKSTYAKSLGGKYLYVSQDEQGSTGHLDMFKNALQNNMGPIIIDRINHTREQRYRYTSLAKAAGYSTKIIELFEKYQTCYNRILERDNHPTINSKDTKQIQNALDMYFNQYEVIGDNEADVVVRSNSNPIVLDLTEEFNKSRRAIVVGDLHGCYDELIKLLTKVDYDPSLDLLLSAGDLVDRGPKIADCLYMVLCSNKHNKTYAVRGNHDDKWLRFLRGNKVNTKSLSETIRQTDSRTFITSYVNLFNTMHQTIIKFGNNYITHAGFNPNRHPEHTTREFSLYARKYDDHMQTFTNDNTAKYWYEFPRKFPMFNLFFGHEVHTDKCEVAKGIYAMDAGCVFGEKLRVAIVTPNGGVERIEEIESMQPKMEHNKSEWDFINKFEPYEKLVEQKYLNKQENGDLVLYNYSDKCTFDKHWNKYTMECRGLILNKITGETMARPFSKFFNLGELESPLLPNIPVGEKYEVYEKVDGSLGILYLDPADNKYKIATRGSFSSDQAKKATEMWYETNHGSHVNTDCLWHRALKTNLGLMDYTLCFEIIYPENRMNDGARLVCDYGSKEMLILLGAINKTTGKDMDWFNLETISRMLDLPIAKKYNYTIDQLAEMKKTLPMQEEGWVIRFESGFRVKVKGDEYCKMQKILNSVTPLHIWSLMSNNPDGFIVPNEYKINIPEEVLEDVNDLESRLLLNYGNARNEVHFEYQDAFDWAKAKFPDNIEKGLGLFSNTNDLKHKSAIFLLHKNNFTGLKKYVSMVIRPKANQLGE